MQPKIVCTLSCQKAPESHSEAYTVGVCVCVYVCVCVIMRTCVWMYINVSIEAACSLPYISLPSFAFSLKQVTFPTMHRLSENKQLSHLRKRVNCLKADVWCFKRKWVNHRLLGVNYVRQTMGLTELPNERYQLMILSHSCPCVCLQSTCPALLLLFSSVCPV